MGGPKVIHWRGLPASNTVVGLHLRGHMPGLHRRGRRSRRLGPLHALLEKAQGPARTPERPSLPFET